MNSGRESGSRVILFITTLTGLGIGQDSTGWPATSLIVSLTVELCLRMFSTAW